MQFVLMIYHGPSPVLPGTPRWQGIPDAEQKQIYADYAELGRIPGVTPGMPLGLPGAARTVQVKAGKAQVHEGVYQPEGVGGYTLFEAEDMDAAIALAAKIPAARLGGAIEVRPVEKYW